jgi:hypothetical protein
LVEKPSLVQCCNRNWNGTNWTEVNDLNTARGIIRRSRSREYSSALAFGGLMTT